MKQRDKQSLDPQEKTADEDREKTPGQAYDLDNVSYFGYTERPFFERLSAGRYRYFYPLLVIFRMLGIRPNHLTALSFLVVFIGFPLFFMLDLRTYAFYALIAGIILDGLDGPLAKLEGRQTRSGAVLDQANDLTCMVVVVVTAAHYELMNPTVAFLYVVSYLYLTFTSFAKNTLRIPYRFVVKTKYPTYIFLFVAHLTGVDITTWWCLAMVIYMIGDIIYSGRMILKKLDEEN